MQKRYSQMPIPPPPAPGGKRAPPRALEDDYDEAPPENQRYAGESREERRRERRKEVSRRPTTAAERRERRRRASRDREEGSIDRDSEEDSPTMADEHDRGVMRPRREPVEEEYPRLEKRYRRTESPEPDEFEPPPRRRDTGPRPYVREPRSPPRDEYPPERYPPVGPPSRPPMEAYPQMQMAPQPQYQVEYAYQGGQPWAPPGEPMYAGGHPYYAVSQAPPTAQTVPIMQGPQAPPAPQQPLPAGASQTESFSFQERQELDRNIVPPSMAMNSTTGGAPVQQQITRSTMLIPDDVLLSLCQDWISADDLKPQLPPQYAQYSKKKILKMLRELRDVGLVDMAHPWGHKPPFFRARAKTAAPTPDDIPPEVLLPCCEGGATPVNVKARMPPQYQSFPLQTIREKLKSLVGRYVEEAFPSGGSQPVYYPIMATQPATSEAGHSGLPQLEDAKPSDSENSSQLVTYNHNSATNGAGSTSIEAYKSNAASSATAATQNQSSGSQTAHEILPYMNTHADGQTAQNKKEVEKVARPGAYSAKNLVIIDLDNMAHNVDVFNEVKCREPDHWEIVSVCGAAYSGPALGTVIRSSEGVKDEADCWAAYILFSRAGRRELKGRTIHLVSRDSIFRSFKFVLEALPEDQRPEKVFFVANTS
eukprot:gb/GECG01007289.1/.p1 GENE.gb/GECG01007289.1/~~gb/GECG01007289.1/.p1  ORF type:complete len:650 (+),score=85.06 gb/GECG01007289.1/:1-1950(+)